uniref:(northern house mosquito) hypothetical protein n=2 Tax=Culex pipiens TaxID=7175 RepID=A0A8D8BXU3_CULPI
MMARTRTTPRVSRGIPVGASFTHRRKNAPTTTPWSASGVTTSRTALLLSATLCRRCRARKQAGRKSSRKPPSTFSLCAARTTPTSRTLTILSDRTACWRRKFDLWNRLGLPEISAREVTWGWA